MASFWFAYGTYLAALACLIFCIREWRFGWKHGLWQIVVLLLFIVLYWALESWAGMRAPFYDYTTAVDWPHRIDRIDFAPLSSWVHGFAPSFSAYFGPGTASGHICAISPLEPDLPLAIPVAGGCISFCLMWTVRLLMGSEGFVKEPFVPVLAPWIVGLMALWLDAGLDPVLATSFDCTAAENITHPGMLFWSWFSEVDLANYWFHIPAYNFGTWYAAPAILTALVILIQWFYQKFVVGAMVDPADGALRALILFFVLVIFFVSPNSANLPAVIYPLIGALVAVGLLVIYIKWESFVRNNDWRWELILVLAFFFLFPVFCLLLGPMVVSTHIWLLLITLFVAGWGIFFAISPYWQLATPLPIGGVLFGIVLTVYILGLLANG